MQKYGSKVIVLITLACFTKYAAGFVDFLFWPTSHFSPRQQVSEILSLLEKENLHDYRLSPKIEDDGSLNQEIQLMAWPLRFEHTSKSVFIAKEENIPENCHLQTALSEVSLVQCQ